MEAIVLLPIILYVAFFVFIISLAVRAVNALERISAAVDRIANKP